MKHDAVQPIRQPEIQSMLWGAAAFPSYASARLLISAIPRHLLILVVLAFLSVLAVPAIAAGAEDRVHERPVVGKALRASISLRHQREVAPGDRPGGVAGGPCGCPASSCDGPNCVITHTCADEVIEYTSISCNNTDGVAFPNGQARCFELVYEEVVGALTVTAVDFGVEAFNPIVAQSTDLNINIYETTTCDPASLATSVLVSTDVVTVDASDNLTMISVSMAVPPTITSGFMILEVENPVDGTANPGVTEYNFYPGCNDLVDACEERLIRAIDCGIPDWVVLSHVGFPNVRLILRAHGTTSCVCAYGDITSPAGLCIPDCTAGPNDVNFDDILCVIDGFSDMALCPCGDICGDRGDPCIPDGGIDFGDILYALDAFAGNSFCPCG